MTELLDQIIDRLGALPPDQREILVSETLKATQGRIWFPTPGPQTDAYLSPADELFFGGQAGGGKSDLIIGLSLQEHQRSLVLRRENAQAVKLVDRYAEIIGSRVGWNGQDNVWRYNGRVIDIGGCQHEDDKQKRKGIPHDLKAYDEVSDFTESQYLFINTWNRSADAAQRCRIVAAGNPPTTAEGLWVIRRWAAWLDERHPNPAKPGELRWFTAGPDGDEIEVEGPGPHLINGEYVTARSRTFIRSKLVDNPYLSATDYASTLAALPPELRAAYRDGRFDLSMKDSDFQVIPTAWITAAMDRWSDRPPTGLAMTAIALDPAGGGRDTAEMASRYGGWYARLVSAQGPETADGSATAATVLRHRRDRCPVVVDTDGGYGGAVMLRLKDNDIFADAYKGSGASTARTIDGQLSFANKRAETWWRFREALDPDQEGGSSIQLPPDNELKADLAAPTWRLTPRGIVLESKEEIRKRIGRSPGKGDAVVMCLSAGETAARRMRSSTNRPAVQLGHQAKRRR